MVLSGFSCKDIVMIFNIFKMSLRDRYLGSGLGPLWAVINPVIFLGMYTFIFGFVFKAKAPGSEATFSYAIYLISGYVPYLAMSEAVATSASSVVGAASMVKNIVFKVECLPIGNILVSMIPFTVGMVFLEALLLFGGNYPSWHIVFLIPVIILEFAFLIGIGFFLSATTVFVRDITQIVSTFMLLVVFFTPIFYTVDMLPGVVRKLNFLNPFYQIMQPYRDILLNHRLPDPAGMAYLLLLTVALNFFGLKYFRRLKGYFVMAL